MINRCKTMARSAMNQAGSELYLASAAYILIPMAFSLTVTFQFNMPANMMFMEPEQILRDLSHMLTPSQTAFLVIGGIVTSVVSLLISYGFTFYTLKAARYEPVRFNDLFVGFQSPGRVLLANIIIYIKMLAWSVITFIPILVLGVVVVYYISSSQIGILVGVWVTVFIALLPFLMVNMRYEQALRIMADDPEISAARAVRLSVKMMRGNSLRLLGLRLSFVLWYILEGMTRGITGVYSKPYIMCAEAAFYDEISDSFGAGPGRPDKAERFFEESPKDFDSLK